ncbi:T9SS type A sorting domain-containing protein [Moheibacter sediminis]|uniref:Por secretion system C-terminal sorting domain-containing protein n=1 Tax=Moheibacter sediminis TaxID=1434700 RepID=A0A1W1YHT8_9FLAO|nr:T9SS type A sorting domain-containing protein [Moheibacter sediminis]SMC35747.1 Por secretion system C-terminal sorting domain-containing protein [Moheibacter sediminis]
MKKLFLCFLFILSSFGFAQCPEGSVFLLCQEDIDQFIIDYPECTEILGDLNLQSTPNPSGESPIINLQGLQNIEKVNGSLSIWWCYHLQSLEGLNNLKNVNGYFLISQTGIISVDNVFSVLNSVGGSFRFHSNESLIFIDDFDNLLFVGDNMRFHQNYNLSSIDGFENLESIGGGINISDDRLKNISGFQNLSYLGGDFQFSHNIFSFEPISISPFDRLTEINGNLRIIQTTIENLNWLNNLNSIRGEVLINSNSSFVEASEMTNLTSINGSLRLMDNNISSLDGFENVEPSDISFLTLNHNLNLSDCSKPNICQYLINGGEYLIENNASGCNSAEEILMNCNMSVADEDLSEKLTVYPNPAKDKLFINSKDLIIQELGLYSTEGKLIQAFKSNNNILDVSKYPSGNYILIVKTGKGQLSKKILISK